jgi:hypothetical protein
MTDNNARTANSTYPKGGVSCSKDSFVVNQTLVFQIKFCSKSPALRVAVKRQRKPCGTSYLINILGHFEIIF